MADSVYNPNTGDIETTFSSLDKSKMKEGFAEISDTNLNNISEQSQIAPRYVRTGELRGDQQVRGLIKTVDSSGRVVVMMGYSQGAF